MWPADNTAKEGKNVYIEKLQERIDTKGNNYLIIMGDMNGRVGR